MKAELRNNLVLVGGGVGEVGGWMGGRGGARVLQ